MNKILLTFIILLTQSCASNLMETFNQSKFSENNEDYSAPTNQLNKTKELIIIFKRKITESFSKVKIDLLMSIKPKIKKLTIAAITLPIAKPTWP